MKRRMAALGCALVLGVSLLLASPGGPRHAAVQAQGMMPDGPALLAAAGNAKEWLMYGHDYTNDRYSALDQINTSNVSQLVPRWIFQTGIVASFETTPVVSNGVMYITTALPDQRNIRLKKTQRPGDEKRGLKRDGDHRQKDQRGRAQGS